MAYATLGDVNALAAKRIFSATSIPSASQVAKYLDFAAAEIDALLAADGYALPVPTTASIGLLFLNRVNAIAAWTQVEHSAQVSQDADRAQKLWDNERAKLEAGGIALYDVPRLVGENYARSMSAPTPFFTRDMPITGLEPPPDGLGF